MSWFSWAINNIRTFFADKRYMSWKKITRCFDLHAEVLQGDEDRANDVNDGFDECGVAEEIDVPCGMIDYFAQPPSIARE